MHSQPPVSFSVSITRILAQLAIVAMLVWLYRLAGVEEAFIFGAFTYALLAILLRSTIAKDHRAGTRLVMQKRFEEAIPHFKKSVDYFTKYAWVDRFRLLTLLSATPATYRQMGLCNIGFCYSQLGNGPQAKAYYEQVLREYPGNSIAATQLNMLRAGEGV